MEHKMQMASYSAELVFFNFGCCCGLGTELDALEADMGTETESEGMPSYLMPDKEPEMDSDLNLPAAPSGHAASSQPNPQVCILNDLRPLCRH